MDDYNGRLNFLALVGVALFLSVVLIGFGSYDNRHVNLIKAASVPVTE